MHASFLTSCFRAASLRYATVAFLGLQMGAVASAQAPAAPKAAKELTAAMRDAYKGVFYANDFSYLDNPNYQGPHFLGDSLKRVADGKLDLGGEFRTRFHHEQNHRGLGLTGRDDQFWLTRTRLFANYRLHEDIRFFGEYLYADSGGEDFASRPIEVNRGEAQNLFLDAKLYADETLSVSTRAGRQELLFGEQRLISPLDWANTRRTFDGVRATVSGAEGSLDLFYTHPVLITRDSAANHEWDHSDEKQPFYGAYYSRRGLPIGTFETYYIGYDNRNAGSEFSYHTLGTRIAGDASGLLYEFEGGIQFGENNDGSAHDSGFATVGLGHKLDLTAFVESWTPTLWLWYDWASGGDADFVALGDDGFNHLFPLVHKYNGFMDLFGRRNLHDINAQWLTPLGDSVSTIIWYHYFLLDEKTTPYNVTMSPFNPLNGAVDRELGHEIDFLVNWTINPRHKVMVGYSYFAAGDYYQTPGTPTDADAHFFYSQYQVSF